MNFGRVLDAYSCSHHNISLLELNDFKDNENIYLVIMKLAKTNSNHLLRNIERQVLYHTYNLILSYVWILLLPSCSILNMVYCH